MPRSKANLPADASWRARDPGAACADSASRLGEWAVDAPNVLDGAFDTTVLLGLDSLRLAAGLAADARLVSFLRRQMGQARRRMTRPTVRR